MKGIAAYLHGIPSLSPQKKSAKFPSREISPSPSSTSPSKTDRGLKRSLSPTFAGLERPPLRRRTASPIAQNLPLRRDPGESSLSRLGEFYGLSGIILPNTRTELISQYQKPLYELPFQGVKPVSSLKRKQVADYQKDAANLMSRSLRRHFLKVFSMLKGLVSMQIPLESARPESRLQGIVSDFIGKRQSPGLKSKNPSIPRVRKRVEKSENVSILQSPTHHHSSLSNGNFTEPLASPQTIDDPIDISHLQTRPVRLKIEGFRQSKPVQNSKIEVRKPQKDVLGGFRRYEKDGFRAEEVDFGLENTEAGDLKLPLVLMRLFQKRVKAALNLIWISMRQDRGSRGIFSFIQRRILLRYQDFLYTLAFTSPKSTRSRPSRPISRQSQESPTFNKRVFRIDSPSKITRKLLETGARKIVAALTSYQSSVFSRVHEFALWRESAMQKTRKWARNLGVVLTLILAKRYRMTLNVLKRLKKEKNKRLSEAKYRLRACFRIFTVKRLKLLTRVFGRLRGNRSQILALKKQEVSLPDAKEIKSQLKGNQLKLIDNHHSKVGKNNIGFDTFPIEKSDAKSMAFETIGLVKIKGMLVNLGKNARFRLGSALRIWRNTGKKNVVDNFEADLVGKICEKLIKSRLFLAFSALKITPRSATNRKLTFALPLIGFLQRKLEFSYVYSFQRIKRAISFNQSSGDSQVSHTISNFVSVLSGKTALFFDAIQEFAKDRGYIKKARRVALRGVGNMVKKRYRTYKEAAFTHLKLILTSAFPTGFQRFPQALNQAKTGRNPMLIQKDLPPGSLIKNRSVFPYQQPSFSTVFSTSESDQSLAGLSLPNSGKKVGFRDRKDAVLEENRTEAVNIQHLYRLYEILSVRVQLLQAMALFRLGNSH